MGAVSGAKYAFAGASAVVGATFVVVVVVVVVVASAAYVAALDSRPLDLVELDAPLVEADYLFHSL